MLLLKCTSAVSYQLIIGECEHLYKRLAGLEHSAAMEERHFVEATPEKGYKPVYKQFKVHHCAVEIIQGSYQISQEDRSHQIHPKIRSCNAKRNHKGPKATSETTGLS